MQQARMFFQVFAPRAERNEEFSKNMSEEEN